jgi:hypothetical protein
MRAFAVEVQLVNFFQRRFGRSRGWKSGGRCSDGQARQCRAILEESSSIRLFRIHVALLSD